MRIATLSARSRVRRISAFCDGGSIGVFLEEKSERMRLSSSRDMAMVKRMGRIVNVYRNESRQTMYPNEMI